MARPVRVYLDSSDFSNLAAPKPSSLFESVGSYLRAAISEGQVELRFSSIHVVEGAATSPEHLRHAAPRLQLMNELCGTRCFVDPFTLMTLELQGTATRSSVVRDDGCWLSEMADLDFDVPSIATICREFLESTTTNRKQRRMLEKRLFDRNGQPSHELRELAYQAFPEQIRALAENYPLTEHGISIAIDVFLGRQPRDRLMNEIKASLGELGRFHNWHEKRWNEISPLLSWLRRSGGQLKELVQDFRAKIGAIDEAARRLGLSEDWIAAERAKACATLLGNFYESMVRKFREELDFRSNAVESNATDAPGISTLACLASEIFRSAVTGQERSRNPKQSDLGDLLHTLYVPYVDVFRSDGFTCAALSKLSFENPNQIVGSLEDIPAAIQNTIARLKYIV